MSTITIKDIAKALNISPSTVSRALRDSYEINIETKKKIVEYAEKMNYSPNPIALSLRENKSKSIGVIVPEIANHFFSQAINGIEDVAYKRGYHVIIFQSHESFEREKANVQHLYSRRVDGLLISLSGETLDISHIEKYPKFPVVYFDRVPKTEEAHKVVSNNFEGAFKATENLILKGKKKIAHITSLPILSITQERLAGYKAALEKYEIEIVEELIKHCSFDIQENEKLIENLIHHQKPDAYFMASDRLALDSFKVIKRAKLDKPTLIGFTNLNVANLLDPPLSTVVQPAFKMGQEAANILLNDIEKTSKKTFFTHLKLDTTLNISE